VAAQVSGQVKDKSGAPVPGATVSIVELDRGATTAADGRFRSVRQRAGVERHSRGVGRRVV